MYLEKKGYAPLPTIRVHRPPLPLCVWWHRGSARGAPTYSAPPKGRDKIVRSVFQCPHPPRPGLALRRDRWPRRGRISVVWCPCARGHTIGPEIIASGGGCRRRRCPVCGAHRSHVEGVGRPFEPTPFSWGGPASPSICLSFLGLSFFLRVVSCAPFRGDFNKP